MKTKKVKKLLLAAALFAVLSVAALTVSAQTQINFKPGQTSTVVTGTLRGYGDQRTFVVHVKRRQTLATESAGKNYVTVEITPPRGAKYDPDMAADCHDRHTVRRAAGGNWRITVTECQKADPYRGRFRLRVSLN